MITLNDTDAMPYGKHKGEPMQDVPPATCTTSGRTD